jgi:hypothetical protein
MQHTDLPIPLGVLYDGIGELSAMYEEDIYRTKVADDEICCYLDVGDWGEPHPSRPRALTGVACSFSFRSSWHGLGNSKSSKQT